jgi:UDP-glucose 4-epimerase
MKVLITGGAGFIGSHLCESYLSQDDDVVVIDNLSTGTVANLNHIIERIELVSGDIRNRELVESLIENCDLVIHMAASVGVKNILKNPIESISTNFFGSEIILKASVKFDKRIVLASTSEIYGKNSKHLLSETDDRVVGPPQRFRWSYSDAKALEESIAHAYFLANDLRVTTLRFFNTVGPRQSGKYGMVMPRFIKAAMEGNSIEIYGDGTQSRVFCHVNDAVTAIMKISDTEKTIGEVINIGGKEEVTITELANLVIKKVGSQSKIIYIPYSESYEYGFEDIQRRAPDLTKVKKLIDWQPVYTLDRIIQDSIDYVFKET